MLENLATGFVLVSQWQNLLAIVAGAVVGYFVGALPGLSAGMGIALLFAAAAVHVALAWHAGRARLGARVRREARSDEAGSRYALGTLALSAAYVAAFDKVPYIVGAARFLLVLMLFAGVRRWAVLCGAALGYAAVTYYVFGRILMVPLP